MTDEERDCLVILAKLVADLSEIENKYESTQLKNLADKIEYDSKIRRLSKRTYEST